MWNILKKIKERRERKEQEFLQFKKEFQEAVASIEGKLNAEYNREFSSAYDNEKNLNVKCPNCYSNRIVDKISGIKGEINGSSSGHGGLFGWSSSGSLHGTIDTHAVKKCNNCQHEWKTNVHYPVREHIGDKLKYVCYILYEFYQAKNIEFDKNDLKEKFNSKEEKILAKENELKNYWAIPKAKELFGGMKVSIVKKMLYEYANDYYKDEIDDIYNEDVLVTYIGLIK